MELKLRVDAIGEYGSWVAAMDIPELYQREFEPIRISDDPMVAMLTGDIIKSEARTVIKARKDAAKILAQDLARMIVAAMEKDDTHNGYRIDERL